MKSIFLILCFAFFVSASCLAQQTETEVEAATPSLRPKITSIEKAKYTEAARDNGIHGIVLLSLIFQKDGKITGIRPIKTLPDGLTEMAIDATKKIRFKPAIKVGVPVSTRMSIEYSFSLEYHDRRHQQKVVAFAFPFLTKENVEKIVQTFDSSAPDTKLTDIWLVTCEKRGLRALPKADQMEYQSLQQQAIKFLSPEKLKIVQYISKLWEDDKIEDIDPFALDTMIFEGLSLAPPETQKRFGEIHNQAVALGLQQFKAK